MATTRGAAVRLTRRVRAAAGLAVVGLLAAACGSSVALPRRATETPGPPVAHHGAAQPLAHIVVLVMENKDYSSVIGSPDAPYTNSLARRYTLLTHMYAITHPSLPNYLALIGGSTFGRTSDCTDCFVGAYNLVDQLERVGIGWKAYMQDLPHPCFTGVQYRNYVRRHDPFMYFDDIRRDAQRCRRIVPLARLARDLQARRLPPFAFVTPGLCADTHDCPVSTGDRFLARWVPRILSGLGHNGVLVVTYDEGEGDTGCCRLARGGRIATVIAGPGAPRHTRVATRLDHFSLLRFIEDNWGLGRLGAAGARATPTLRLGQP